MIAPHSGLLDCDSRSASVHDRSSVDALYDSMKERLRALPEGRVRVPIDQDFGQREFHIIDEDCTPVFFGQPIRS